MINTFNRSLFIWNHAFLRLESRIGRAAASLLIAAALLLIAAFACTPRSVLEYHGLGFSRLSEAPLDFSRPAALRYRILSPLIGYLLFFRGALFQYFMLMVTGGFLAFVYHAFRKREYSPAESFGITAMMTFSTLVFYQFYFPGYTDPATYLLLAVFVFSRRRLLTDLLLVALLLFNHESTLVLFPFLLLLRMDGDPSLESFLRSCGFLILAVLPYLLYRSYVSAHAPVDFSVDYYFDENNLNWTRQQLSGKIPFGIFQAFRLFWILPIMALVINAYKKNFGEFLLMIALFLGVSAQFYVAYDVSRLAGLAFPLVLSGAVRVREFIGKDKFVVALFILILLNFFVPAWCIGALDPIFYGPWWLNIH